METKDILISSLVLLLGGCIITSLHPLYTDGEVVFDEKLIGKWSSENDIWEFRPDEGQRYKMRVLSGDKQGHFVAHLVRLKDMMFLDVLPAELPEEFKYNEYYMLHLIPTHSFMKVNQIEPKLQLLQMDVDEVSNMLKADPNILKHEVIEDRIVLTAQPKELQDFMLKYADTEDLFSDPLELTRREPLYTDEDLIFDENLIGVWEGKDGQLLDSIAVAEREKTYSIILADKEGVEFEVFANLVKLKDMTFLALFLDESFSDEKDSYRLHLIPDFFALVEQIGPILRLRHIPYDEIAEWHKADFGSLKKDTADSSSIFEGTRIQQ
ncbi:MAG: hypothetical protein FVQ85_07785 [Planctomycetes bacterium]|nr:hypothetical protein [Planctomycetota bacterium]